MQYHQQQEIAETQVEAATSPRNDHVKASKRSTNRGNMQLQQ
jgi:hypothetical protein